MNQSSSNHPRTLALFEKRIDGDDCLLELARMRFRQACMGTEIYAPQAGVLEWMLGFRPDAAAPVVAHLSRAMNVAEAGCHPQIEEFARQFAGRVHGLVVHDHALLAERPQDYLRAAQELNRRLQSIPNAPWLFVEYAAGVELAAFVEFARAAQSLDRLSVCVDVGHVGIQQIRQIYFERHPRVDVCTLKSQPALKPETLAEVEAAKAGALPAVLNLIGQLENTGKPVHFHLHDGHPLSTFSPFGVADHLSFLTGIPVDKAFPGSRRLPLMFGPGGLFMIIGQAMHHLRPEHLSFTLEIHPPTDQLDLGDASSLFAHWRDKTNAEKMNCWLAVLAENHQLLALAIKAAQPQIIPSGHPMASSC